jgi:hypothetical protein
MFALDKADRRMSNMSEMMGRLGLDPVLLAHAGLGLNYRSAIQHCRSCRADEECRNWLSREAKSIDRAPAFCPNAELFARTRADQGIN